MREGGRLCIYSWRSRDYRLHKVKQPSERSIDWDVNTGSNGSSRTAAGGAAVFIALHCQLGGGGGGVFWVFFPLKLLIKMLLIRVGGSWEMEKQKM